MRPSDHERSRSSFGSAIAAPAVLKALCGAVLTVLVVVAWQQSGGLRKQQEVMANWESVNDFAIFYPRMVGDDQQELETGGHASTVAEARDLYPALYAAGAIYIDAANYQVGVLPDPSATWPVPPIQVNTNYLKQYPIKDTAGKPIEIGEDEQAWVVAVPEQFKQSEAKLRELLRWTRGGGEGITGAFQAEGRITGKPAPERFANQEVKIVWTASGQDVFSFDPEVNPDHGNTIKDPIVQIMTPANSLTVDRLNSITGGLDTALKLRVDGDPAGTLARLAPLLEKLKLDDNLLHLVSVHEAMGTQVSEVRGALTKVVAFAVGALVVLVVLNAAIVIIGSDRLRRRLTVRRLHGIGFGRSYRELLVVLGGSWVGQTLLACLAVAVATSMMSMPGEEVSPFAQIPKLFAVALAALVVEALFVVVTARIVERRNAVKRLKEL